MQATISHNTAGKVQFDPIAQTWMTITATVPYVTNFIREKFGNGYTLVTDNGLKIQMEHVVT